MICNSGHLAYSSARSCMIMYMSRDSFQFFVTVLLTLICTCVLSASSPICEPDTKNENRWIKIRERLTGCWTSFVGDDKAEVHILKLDFDAKVSMSKLYNQEV